MTLYLSGREAAGTMHMKLRNPETGDERAFTRCLGGWRVFTLWRYDREEMSSVRFVPSDDAETLADELSSA